MKPNGEVLVRGFWGKVLGMSYQVKGPLGLFANERLGNGGNTGRSGHFGYEE